VLGVFLARYYAERKTELGPGTLELHQKTGRYLIGHFGEYRRLDTISRQEARSFKTALADGQLAHINKRQKEGKLAATTVDQHVRHARKIFNHALDDDLITFNPFDRLGQNEPVEKDWHYVDRAELAKLMGAARPGWRLLLALCRWAGLRLEEALELPWAKIDWAKRRITVLSRADWSVKDKDARTVPIGPELHGMLKSAYDPESKSVIPESSVSRTNLWRDAKLLCKRAGVTPYAKPFHALRKSCITDWASKFPAHVVKEWAGHGDLRTTLKFYLKVSEGDYLRAAGLPEDDAGLHASEADFERAANLSNPDNRQSLLPLEGAEAKEKGPAIMETAGPSETGADDRGADEVVSSPPGELTQLLTQLGDSEAPDRRKSKAGEGIRTPDVQLGKMRDGSLGIAA
jgi:site-specific recombinase XerD